MWLRVVMPRDGAITTLLERPPSLVNPRHGCMSAISRFVLVLADALGGRRRGGRIPGGSLAGGLEMVLEVRREQDKGYMNP